MNSPVLTAPGKKTAINHFYEKLLTLQERPYTETYGNGETNGG